VHFIDADVLYNKTVWSEAELDQLAADNNVASHINVYVIDNLLGGSVSTFTREYQLAFSTPMNRPHRSVSLWGSDATVGLSTRTGRLVAPIVAHEIGHYFNLFHPFETGIVDAGVSCPEDPSSPFNGDLIADTYPEPDPGGSGTQRVYDGSTLLKPVLPVPPYSTVCQSTDWGPIRQLLEQYNSRNFMTYNSSVLHTDTFTGEQAVRIRNQWALYMQEELAGERVVVTNASARDEVNLGGTYSVVDESASGIGSGDGYRFSNTTNHVMRPDQERLSQKKHKDWNHVSNSHRLSLQVSHPSSNLIVRHRAYFDTCYSAQLGSVSIDAGGGLMQFRDPWYLHSNGTQPDSFFTYTGAFSPTGAWNQPSGGVFVNQEYDPQNPSLPHYSLRAPASQTVSGIPWYFWKWETSGALVTSPYNLIGGFYESPVIFRPWGTRNVTAKYKGHRASSLASATGTTSQRRLVRDYADRLHLVYESAGEVWYTRSTDNGSSWTAEILLSSGLGNSLSPSIA
jgi:hypothetical protein